MKIATLSYRSLNLGDNIQAIALERLLPRVDLRIDRDDLAAAELGDDVRLIVNGWRRETLPPRGKEARLVVGYHADCRQALSVTDLLVGCRDPWTLALCGQAGILSWLSWCATMTLEPLRGPRTADIVFADVPLSTYPTLPIRPSVVTSHNVPAHLSPAGRRRQAEDLLTIYARAKIVVTTRLHALLPCAAFGTPVVLLEPVAAARRFSGFAHFAWQVHDAPWESPRPAFKAYAVRGLTDGLRNAVSRFVEGH